MEELARQGLFSPPSLDELESAFDQCLSLPAVRRGDVRVFVDLWDVERLTQCRRCRAARIERLKQMNLSQHPLPSIFCDCGTAG